MNDEHMEELFDEYGLIFIVFHLTENFMKILSLGYFFLLKKKFLYFLLIFIIN